MRDYQQNSFGLQLWLNKVHLKLLCQETNEPAHRPGKTNAHVKNIKYS